MQDLRKPIDVNAEAENFTKTAPDSSEALGHFKDALERFNIKQFTNAVESFQKAIESIRNQIGQGKSFVEANLLLWLANSQWIISLFDQAMNSVNTALSVHESLKTPETDKDLIHANYMKARLYYDSEQYPEAKTYMNKVIDILKNNSSENRLELANLYVLRGLTLYEEVLNDDAIADYKQAITLFELLKDKYPNAEAEIALCEARIAICESGEDEDWEDDGEEDVEDEEADDGDAGAAVAKKKEDKKEDKADNIIDTEEKFKKLRSALEIFEKNGDKLKVGEINYELAKITKKEEEILELSKKALEIYTEFYGEKYYELGLIHTWIAYAYGGLDKHTEALEHRKTALEIIKPTNVKAELTSCYENLAICLENCEKYEESRETYEIAISFDPEGEKAMECIHAIGRTYDCQDQLDKALEYYEKAIEKCKDLFGTDEQRLEEYYGDVCNVYWEKGLYDKVIEITNTREMVVRNSLGNDAIELCDILEFRGFAVFEKGDYDGALELYKKSLDLKKELLGEDDPECASEIGHIAYTLSEKGGLTKALEFNKKAYDLNLKEHGEDSYEIARNQRTLGHILIKQNKASEALPILEKTLEIFEKVKEDIVYEFEFAESKVEIGLAKSQLGDHEGAVNAINEALTLRRTKIAEDHPETARFYQYLGQVLKAKGDFQEALNTLEKSVQIRKKYVDATHPDLEETEKAITACKKKLGQ